MVIRVFVNKKADYMAADKSGTASNDDIAFESHDCNGLR